MSRMLTGAYPRAPVQAPVVSVCGLSKTYGKLTALNEIDFQIYEGEIFGLIGPDGAGKTSSFHILGGIMNRSAGDVSVLGEDPRKVRLEIGYLTQTFSLYQDLSINENIEYAARIREVPEADFKRRRQRYLSIMGLEKFGERLAGNLSGGMKQKLALCCALVARPKLLLLDEPTTGVDPVSRRDFWDVLGAIALEGVTVAVATPYLDEAERCSRIALIHKGRILQSGSPQELKSRLGLQRLELRSSDIEASYDQLEREIHRSDRLAAISDLQLFGDRIDVLVKDLESGKLELNKVLSQRDELEIVAEEATLENVFVASLSSHDKSPELPFPLLSSSVRKGKAIAAEKISKNFGSFQAAKNISIEIDYGEIYGLLGANGAGKTTTIKMLCGLLDISSGKISLAGRKSDLRNVALRREIGYMSQKFVLYDDLTVMENLNFYSGSYGLSSKERKERIAWAIDTFELEGNEGTMAAALPGGWKQKLSFAASVLHQPSIIFLDEPTSGVDPLARRQLWKYIRQFARNGAAVLVTTHFLEEAEHCGKLGFMVDGELVAEGSPSEIKAAQPGVLLALKVSSLQEAYQCLRKHIEPWKVSIFGSALHVVLESKESGIELCRQILVENGLELISSRQLHFSLEDAFIGIVQRSKRGI
ncbi:MAG: ATP-binding cassette domain-containing protein [Candidatus Obscuribacterales bacterium]|nr:ATP-binding cassette domain-containing protein [Candidatus Obscuribacterales bacterium]